MTATVRFYFDADILGLAHVICALRPDCSYPGDPGATIKRRTRPACVVETPKAKDREWIPVVAEQGWIAITRDSNILDHLSLLEAVKTHRLRLVTLSGRDGSDKWGQLEIAMSQWRQIEALHDRNGPLIVSATRTTFREIEIDERLDELRGLATKSSRRRVRKPAPGTGETAPLW
ncbi:PIN-like domain-containing protein [Mycobacterium branderi]|uniref:VapC45 PIN like domain-containing protein n=1 Tax=Mycobacterium branderi TaxID=43348 RepID=A0A7I7WE47_9MYCO|nr:hypothetical protein [Mycobacterium branderi]MCV7236316.1 hypothetical protein [Mycobacterium branderi]ORA35486.1 hypothetical protein BST20_18035 [Mycobacterium branderi]BBZ15202.1 hypothetical protein MBRA_53970 [Mycobacterium branderi]